MPIIPRINESVQMQPKNPTHIAGTTDTRIPGESIAQFGKSIVEISDRVIKEYDDLTKNAKRNKIEEGKSQLQNIYRGAAEHALQTSQSDGSDLNKNFYEKANPYANEVLGSFVQDRQSYQEVQSFAKRLKYDADTSLEINRVKMMETDNWNKLADRMDVSADRVRENPSEAQVIAEQQEFGVDMDKRVSDGIFDPDKAFKLRKLQNEKLSTAFIDGLMNTKQYGKALNALSANQVDPDAFVQIPPDQAVKSGFIDQHEAQSLMGKGEMYKVPTMLQKDKVQLTPEMAVILNGMPTEKKARLLDQVRSKLREDSDMKLSDLNASINGFEKLAHNPSSDYSDKAKSEIIKNINNNSLLTVFARRRAIDAVNTADAVHEQLKLAASTPRSQFPQLIEGMGKRIAEGEAEAGRYDKRMIGLGTDTAVQANRMESAQHLATSLKKMIDEDNKDPVAFNIRNNSDLELKYKGSKDNTPEGFKATQQFVSNSLALQKYRGVPDSKQRVLTNSEVSNYANLLHAAPDSGTANNVLTAIQTRYGEYAARAISEITSKDKELQPYGAAAYVAPNAREGLVDSIKNKTVIEAQLKKEESWNSTKAAMNASINTSLGPFRKAMNMSTNDASGENVTGKYQAAMELRVKSIISKSPSVGVMDATQQAYDEIVGSQYHIASSSNSTVIVPKNLADKQIVESYLKVYSRKENLGDLNLSVPKDYKDPNEFYEYLSKQSRWVTTPNQNGVKLMQMTPAGKMQPVYDKYGQPVIKSYEEINKRPGKKVVDEDKDFMGRLFGG